MMTNFDNYDPEDLVNQYERLEHEYEFALEVSKILNPATLLNLERIDQDIQVFKSAFIFFQVCSSFRDLKIFYLALINFTSV